MNLIEDAAAVALRAFAIDGVPASGAHEPGKTELIDVFGVVETRIAGVEAVTTAGIKWTSQSIRVRSTANVVIASALENGDTLNGVTLATGDHVFLGSQTDPAQNGLYTVVASGAAARATFADSAAELAYIGFLVREGTVGAGERWTLPLAAAAITLGATSLTFAPVGIEVSYATEVADASGDYATLPDRLDANDDVVLAVPNVFPGKDLSTAVWYASGTAPAAFRTAEAAARGLATGVADAGGGVLRWRGSGREPDGPLRLHPLLYRGRDRRRCR